MVYITELIWLLAASHRKSDKRNTFAQFTTSNKLTCRWLSKFYARKFPLLNPNWRKSISTNFALSVHIIFNCSSENQVQSLHLKLQIFVIWTCWKTKYNVTNTEIFIRLFGNEIFCCWNSELLMYGIFVSKCEQEPVNHWGLAMICDLLSVKELAVIVDEKSGKVVEVSHTWKRGLTFGPQKIWSKHYCKIGWIHLIHGWMIYYLSEKLNNEL